MSSVIQYPIGCIAQPLQYVRGLHKSMNTRDEDHWASFRRLATILPSKILRVLKELTDINHQEWCPG